MDIVKRLRGHAKGNAGGVRELLMLSADEIERLRQQNAELRENNKLLYNLFHEAVALPQGVCPRPATAGDGMFNPQHRALNKPTGGY